MLGHRSAHSPKVLLVGWCFQARREAESGVGSWPRCRSLVILCSADGRRESAICRVPVQRATFRPAPPGDPSRCLSGDRESRPERHQ